MWLDRSGGRKSVRSKCQIKTSLLFVSWVLCSYVIALTKWSFILKSERHLKYCFKFSKVSKGNRCSFQYYFGPFDKKALNFSYITSFTWNPLLWGSLAIYLSTFSSFLSSSSLYRVVYVVPFTIHSCKDDSETLLLTTGCCYWQL